MAEPREEVVIVGDVLETVVVDDDLAGVMADLANMPTDSEVWEQA